ncbi:iron-containing alcohol dehydrogenase [Azospirillum sp.]|uniref:iron-containing alcohol dehydrogenase n=1 Tax=Azospirillum sp. TaxID=34012 RepID=UPI002D56DAB9|nr:iron-containing alcohol dehydrogenase [Azospirillum sp.]HYD70030.1 iron-containing alcohol dehydrogenase [Azospirillum sp.]
MSPALLAPFGIARLPRIVFGAGTVATLPAEVAALGTRALLVTGSASFRATPRWQALTDGLATAGVSWATASVAGEPTPEQVDAAVAEHRAGGFDVVVGIGGGAALDFAKAVAGLLVPGNSVMDHLEGVGPELPYRGPALPFIAVPTTAGTGSEATKNAVLSRSGADGFKKSFRHDDLVARLALVDPDLLDGCPPALIAANGMDAFTQLLESYVSTRANPMTDALAWSGLEAFAAGFFAAWQGGADAPAGRSQLAYAALLSGICLAQTGLGSVHGLASPLGAFFPIPHGVVCGTLVADATDVNVAALRARAPDSPALRKYARVGRLLGGLSGHARDAEALDTLVGLLRAWQDRLALPRLSTFGVGAGDVDRIVANSRGSSMKTNPLVLTDAEIAEVVRRRL